MLMTNPNVSGQHILLLATSKGIEIIDINTIVRVEAISNYSKLYFSNDKTLVVAKILSWFEERLSAVQSGVTNSGQPGDIFIRTHRTHLVNRKYIRHYQSGKIKLLNGECVDVAKRKRTYFLKCLLMNVEM